MKTRARSSLALVAVAGLTPMVLGSGPQEPVAFRTTSELVVVQAVVFSSDPGPVTVLTANDFSITEEGQERPVSVFIGPDSGPLEVALVIDSSASMTRWPTREATMALLNSLDPGSCVLMVPFDDRVRTAVWGHPGDQSVRAAVAGLEFNRGTALYDGLVAAFHLMRTRAATQDRSNAPPRGEIKEFSFGDLMRFRRPGPTLEAGVVHPDGNCTVWRHPFSRPASGIRRVVAVVTDGQDNKSRATIEDVILSAWGSNVPVFAFAATEQPRSGNMDLRGEPYRLGHLRALQQLAEYTGGIVLRATMDMSGQPFWDGFERLGEALRGHYVLGYVPEKGKEAFALVDRRSIKVSVHRRGLDVMAPSNLVLGRGASEGAALDLALRGFHELASGRAEQALAAFETAAALGPGLGLVHYGQGTALSLLERPVQALAAFEIAAALAPWLPDLNARTAELLVQTGDLDAAWEHVLRAYRGGSQVLDLIDRLQQLAPRQVDLTWPPLNPRIRLRATGSTSLLGALASEPVLASLGTAIHESTRLSLAFDGGQAAQIVLVLDVTKARRHGRRVSLYGWLTLENPAGKTLRNPAGKKVMERRFSLQDMRSAEELQSVATAAVREIERALAAGDEVEHVPSAGLRSFS